MKKNIALLLIIAFLAFAIAACGSDSSSSSSTDGSTGEASELVKVIDIPLTQEEYAFGVDKNQPELLEEANKFIAQINSDGTFEQILNNYFG
ncbi:MAG: amino acid ABC transporter substrate-binding protein, partial [Clostridia bacterium]|nr:amino acid ABC transporter substrate-binding protein [Clostridia bacterium]